MEYISYILNAIFSIIIFLCIPLSIICGIWAISYLAYYPHKKLVQYRIRTAEKCENIIVSTGFDSYARLYISVIFCLIAGCSIYSCYGITTGTRTETELVILAVFCCFLCVIILSAYRNRHLLILTEKHLFVNKYYGLTKTHQYNSEGLIWKEEIVRESKGRNTPYIFIYSHGVPVARVCPEESPGHKDVCDYFTKNFSGWMVR